MGERQAGADGLDMGRVAEIMVSRGAARAGTGGSSGRRGSGYRVADRFVLTAAHVVAEPTASVRVRFDADRPGEWSTEAGIVLNCAEADLALLELDVAPMASGPVPRYGAVPDEDVVLPFTAVGFPRFKLRADTDPARRPDDGSLSQYRDSCHVTGTLAALSNRREGTLELGVLPPGADTVEPDRSPWQGMSGAAVWSGGAVIGMVASHHRSDGLGRLAATRVTRWYETLSKGDLAVLRSCAGLPAPGELATVGADEGDPAVPSLASLPHNLTLAHLTALVDALAGLPTVRRSEGLETVLRDVDRRVDANRDRVPALRPALYSVLRTCLRYPGTLDQFLDTLRRWEEGSEEMKRVDQEAARLSRDHG